jgi:hypothetical protein
VFRGGDDIQVQVDESRQGDPVPRVDLDGRSLRVHSRGDPFRESERMIQNMDPSAFDCIVVLGFGFAYHLELLLERLSPAGTLLVIERHGEMVKRAMENRDLTFLFGDERFALLVNPGSREVAEELKKHSTRRVTILLHRGSAALSTDYYEKAREWVRSHLSMKEVNIATLARFERIWGANIARNLASFISSAGVGAFYGQFKGMTAIVIGAGPSLEDSIPHLRRLQEKCVVVAVDTVYSYLMERGVEPHFCLSVDPQVINARYFEGAPAGRTVLVFEPTVHPAALRFFPGRAVSTGVAFELLGWIERMTGRKGEITHGGSVSTNAADMAHRLGVDRVVLVGQDLSFPDGRAHVRGARFEELQHRMTNRVKTVEMMNRGQLYALPRIDYPSLDGGDVHTNQKMMVFIRWFEEHAHLGLVNGTARGVLLNNIPPVSLDELAGSLEDHPVRDTIDRILDEETIQGEKIDELNETFLSRIEEMTREVGELIPLLEEGVNLSGKLAEEISGGGDGGKTRYLLQRLDDLDRKIKQFDSIREMISFTTQRVIHTITEGYEIEEEGEPEGEAARRSAYLYKGLLEGARFNQKLFRRMTGVIRTVENIS